MPEGVVTPPVLWAQRKESLYLLINVIDCEKPVIKVDKDKLYFKAKGGSDNKDYEVTLEFFKDINPETSRQAVRGRGAEFVLMKAESGKYWDRLLKDKAKHHWLKVDFNKWRDEDDSDNEFKDEEADFDEIMKGMAGLNSSSKSLEDLEADSDEDSSDDAGTSDSPGRS